MKYFGAGWSEAHKALSQIIRKPEQLARAKKRFLDVHARLNLSEVSGGKPNEADALLLDLAAPEWCAMPTVRDETIAWAIWHIARIEDLTMNILVARQEQVLDARWHKALGTAITDTGNALSDDEILQFSKTVDFGALLAYRTQVAKTTRAIVAELKPGDMKRKVAPEDVQKIADLGGVTGAVDSRWLLEFWGAKDVAGILLMPPTRHVLLHLNDCAKWKEHLRKGKSVYRA